MHNRFLFVEIDKYVYTKLDVECIIICLYVDDMLIVGNSLDVIHRIKSFLLLKFNMKDTSETSMILGVKIIRKSYSIMLSQEHNVENLLKSLDILMSHWLIPLMMLTLN